MRHSMLTLLLVLIAAAVRAADMPREHVFSMSFKVTSLNGEMATPEGREKAMPDLAALAERLAGAERGPYWMDANGVSTHYFYSHGMTTIVTVNTKTGKMDALVQPARQEPPGDPGFVLPTLPGL